MSKPEVSVVCAWYNRADYVRDTIDSLLAQDFHSFEVVIINDGSPDHRVRKILDSYNDPRLRVFHQENTGFTVAIRRAIEMTDAPFVAIQGAGDVSFSARLRKQWEAMQRIPELGICGCTVSNVEVDGVTFRSEKVRPAPKAEPTLRDLTHGYNPFTHGEVMFRRVLYEKVGGYRPFFKYAQDRDLWLRMSAHCRLAVLDTHLYQRRQFIQDGISTCFDKKLIQKRLSAFAVQCHFERALQGYDCVERYGYLAGLFRKPSPIVADFFAKLTIKEVQFGTRERARFLLNIALQEKRTQLARLAHIMTAVSVLPSMRSVIRLILRSRSHNRSVLR